VSGGDPVGRIALEKHMTGARSRLRRLELPAGGA